MASDVQMPDSFTDDQVLEWDRVVAELKDRDIPLHRSLLTLYCQTWAINQEANKYVVQLGTVINSNGQIITSPFYRVYKETTIILNNILGNMGLTPASKVGKAEESTEELPLD